MVCSSSYHINTQTIQPYRNITERDMRLQSTQLRKSKIFFLDLTVDIYCNVYVIFTPYKSHNDEERFWSNASVDDWAKEMAGMRIIIEKFANLTDNSVVGVRAPYLRVGGNNQFTMMEEQAFLYDSTITAPLSNPPLWPYTMYFRMPHRCHGNLQNCPTRSHAVWEMVMNELDRREDPNIDEDIPGCAMVICVLFYIYLSLN